jgi:hypothetical protein
MKRHAGWALLFALNVLAYCVLGFYQTSIAGSPGNTPPFANTTESRLEMVEQLKEIKNLLKEQNALLRSGDVKVIITELPKPTKAESAPPAEPAESAPPAEPAPAPAAQEQK